MPWNTTSPLGSVSVQANRAIGQQNTTYIETTMGNSIIGTNTNTTRDHFWNVGSNEDGRHRFMNSPAFTVGGNPDDPVIGTGMDAVMYLKTINGRAEWFSRNAEGIYQFCPSFISGTVNIIDATTYSIIVAIPANCYGDIYFFNAADPSKSASGVFSSSGTQTRGFTTRVRSNVSGLDEYAIELRNTNTGSLNLEARLGDGSSSLNGNWNYRITYRAL